MARGDMEASKRVRDRERMCVCESVHALNRRPIFSFGFAETSTAANVKL